MNQLQLVLTPEAIQRYIRIGLNLLSGALISHGLVSPTATWLPTAIGIGTFALTLAWSVYGNRVIARLQEVAKVVNPDGSQIKIIADQATAVATPEQPNILSKDDVKVVVK